MGLSQGFGGSFRYADVTDLSGLYRLPHRSDRFLDRCSLVYAVQVPEINMVGYQMAKGPVECPACVLRGTVRPMWCAVVVELNCELRGNAHAIAVSAKRLPQQLLIGEGPVGLSGVEHSHPEVQC